MLAPALESNQENSMRGFAVDAAVIIMLVILVAILSFSNPFLRPLTTWDLQNPDLRHPYLQDIVPFSTLMLISILLPIVIIAAVARNTRVISAVSISFAMGALVTLCVTDLLKLLAGRFRPDFIDRCKPIMSTLLNGTLPNNDILECTGSVKLIRNGRLSWPSGHASQSFFGLVFLTFWMYETMDAKKWKSIRLVISILPILLAAFVAISRWQQNVHHPTDLISGTLLGGSVAYFYYFHHYNKQ